MDGINIVTIVTQDGIKHVLSIPANVKLTTIGGNIKVGKVEEFADETITITTSSGKFRLAQTMIQSLQHL